MSHFRTGKFDREQSPKVLRPVTPESSVDSILEISLSELAESGCRLVLLDVDNTILPWRSTDLPDTSLEWVGLGKQLGLQFCLISNTRNPERLRAIAEKLGVKALYGKFKPSRTMFVQAMQEAGVEPHQTVMIGDQLFTDVLGANRSGVRAIWVRPLSKREFVGTKANRVLERFVGAGIYRAMLEEEDDLPIVKPEGIFQRRIVRQFAKFCIVGGSSFVVDAGLHNVLMFRIPYGSDRLSHAFGMWLQQTLHGSTPTEWQAHNAAFQLFKVLTAGLAIMNSFYWNRRWTFGIQGSESRREQLVKFVVVSLIGLGLNVLIASGLSKASGNTEQKSWWFATLVATFVVAIWNFTGQRLWAFRRAAK